MVSEGEHKTVMQLNDKDFKNLSGDHQRTNIIWKVQNNELHRQIKVITTKQAVYTQLWKLQN